MPADQVVAAVRKPAKAEKLTPSGVEIRHADYTKPETLATGFAGVDRPC